MRSSSRTLTVSNVETLRGKHIVVPGLVNRLYVFVSRLLPVQVVPNLIRFINRQRGQREE